MAITTRPARPDWDNTPTREEAGASVFNLNLSDMLQVLDLIEYGRSQALNKDQLLVIKSYVDEMIEKD